MNGNVEKGGEMRYKEARNTEKIEEFPWRKWQRGRFLRVWEFDAEVWSRKDIISLSTPSQEYAKKATHLYEEWPIIY